MSAATESRPEEFNNSKNSSKSSSANRVADILSSLLILKFVSSTLKCCQIAPIERPNELLKMVEYKTPIFI